MPERKTPNVFQYHDYREFLRAWLEFHRTQKPKTSLRALSGRANLSPGYLPQVLAGDKNLSRQSAQALGIALGLQGSELSYFLHMVGLGSTNDQDSMNLHLTEMRRYKGYRVENPQEAKAHEYLTHWYYVAIRELASCPGFNPDPKWIAKSLRFPVEEQDILSALRFLIENQYISILPDGSYRANQEPIECLGGVYRLALGQFHQEMMQMAINSIASQTSTERKIVGFTAALTPHAVTTARSIVEEAYQKIRALASSETPDTQSSVFHAEFAFFPLTVAGGTHDQ